jgi:hypothetical protein
MPGQIERAFSETADPSAYVPREATERVLESLRGWVDAGASAPSVAALIAPPGLGKTFMLRLLESRLERVRSAERRASRALYLPYAGLLLPDLRDWVTGLLAWPMPSSSRTAGRDADSGPRVALEDLVRLARDRADPLVLLMDDADSMPAETARVLAESLPREGSPLRLLMALGMDARSSRLLASFDAMAPLEVRLEAPMSEEETAAYVRGRLRWADPSTSDRLDPGDLRRIHGLSGGIPRQVHRVAASVLVPGDGDRPSDLDSKLRREDWMGRPIEDDL